MTCAPACGSRLLHPADRASHRVDLDPLAAVLPAQILVEEALEAALSHHGRRAGIAPA